MRACSIVLVALLFGFALLCTLPNVATAQLTGDMPSATDVATAPIALNPDGPNPGNSELSPTRRPLRFATFLSQLISPAQNPVAWMVWFRTSAVQRPAP